MLDYTKEYTLKGKSVIDGVDVEGYTAVINSAIPENLTLSSYPINKTLLKENRVQCRADEAEFEDIAYALQDELLEAKTETAE